MPETYKEQRSWGHFERFSLNEPVTVKLLFINKGQHIHLQTHENRHEFWRLVSGEAEVTIGTDTQLAKPGQEFFAPAHTAHKISALQEDVVLLEVSRGNFDEKDIVHLEQN